MITFTCGNCNQSLTVPDDSAGKKGKCPQCGNLVEIPTSSPLPAYSPPPLSQAPPAPPMSPPAAEPVFITGGPSEDSYREPAGKGVFQKPVMEFVLTSFLLGGLALLNTGWIIAVRPAGVFPSIMMSLAVLGLGGFGLTLGLFAMLKAMNQRMAGFWYVLTALVVSGTAVLMGLIMFIVALTVRSTP
jgi:hypothetical protein